ncbi:MAG: hypothetical protein J6Y89_06635 [Lachnospiraceae bacterium]|nr:hypothetical protein [Lachnospiraceae bacterium]
MDEAGLKCNGCGSTNVVFDPKTRILYCNQCGNSQQYSRATLNRNGKVLFGKQNAIKFFKEARYAEAHNFAMDVLNVSMDNVPAMYIMAYYNEFEEKKNGALKAFFEKIKKTEDVEGDEIRDLAELFVSSDYRLCDYEEDVIEVIAVNMQADEDIDELSQFIEKICPNMIPRRASSDYLSGNLLDMYIELAEHCNIPKTCYSLLKSIDSNPDSPAVRNSFDMKAASRHYFEHYVLNVGKVLAAMRESEFKSKFLGAYSKLKSKYESAL